MFPPDAVRPSERADSLWWEKAETLRPSSDYYRQGKAERLKPESGKRKPINAKTPRSKGARNGNGEGNKQPLTSAPPASGFLLSTLRSAVTEDGLLRTGLLSQFQLFSPPARALAAKSLNLERTLSELANQACALTPAEIGLPWCAGCANEESLLAQSPG